jgi:hypothetical protein
MADFIKGEAKDCGVRWQARREPFDFTITSATFALEKQDGTAAQGFTFNAANISIQGHDVFYLLDSTGIAAATTPYNGIFTVVIDGRTYKKVILVTISKAKRA